MATTPASASAAERAEIAFFDVETSVPPRRTLLEFGAILVCPRSLVEVSFYATLVRPADPAAAVPATTSRCNGITQDAVARAPPFCDVADDIYNVLHGRVWAGHNILGFDAVIIRDAFAEIGRSPPQPKGFIDTLHVLTQRFGKRAGDMKLASLANYFGLGRQRHRSLDDVRMNLEVLKYCATVLFLETSPLEVFIVENLLEGAITRSQANGPAATEAPRPEANSSPATLKRQRTVYPVDNETEAVDGEVACDPATNRESAELVSNIEEMKLWTTTKMDAGSSGYSGFLEPDDVSIECIKITVALLHQFRPKTLIQHKDTPLQLCCAGLKVRFGVSAKFPGNAGRPKLNIVVDIPENLSQVLEFCDDLAQRSSPESGGTSEWRPLIKKYGNMNRPTVRLNIPTVASGDIAIYSTDMYKKERDGTIQKLVFSKVDAVELDSMLRGNMVDAFFSLQIYDYQQNAGIRLVANMLVIHSK